MKSLKRTLSLVLVLVMVLGLFGVAGAAYTDDKEIQYKEAVGVMTGIGAIAGMGDGTFAPKGNLTRAQAAKMVTYAILGEELAKNLPSKTSSFKDVTAAGGFGWAIPSIEYLKSVGIVAGRGDGIYDPNGNVTGYELAKMLLCALGYGKNNDFAGENFELGVALLANKTNIFVGSKATNKSAPATREEAALYCFNTIAKCKTVTFNKDDEVYTESTAAKDTIGKVVYALNDDSDSDMFGAPATIWKAGAKEIYTIANDPAVTFTATTTEAAVGKTLKGYTVKDDSVTPMVNGVAGTPITALTGIDDLTGNGVVVKIYAGADKVITNIVVLQYTFEAITVTNVPATKTAGAHTLYTAASGASGKVFSSVVNEDTDVDTAKISGTVKTTDKVLTLQIKKTVSGDTPNVCLFVSEAPTVTGICSGVSNTDVATIGGKQYAKSAAANATVPATSTKEGTYYTDLYGYVVGTKTASAAGSYGFVIAAKTYNTLVDGVVTPAYSAIVALSDGTVTTLAIDSASYAAYAAFTGLAAATPAVSPAVSYADANGDGKYELTTLNATTNAALYSELTAIVAKANTLTTTGTIVKYANAATKFVVTDYAMNAAVGARAATGTVTTYTGIANVGNYPATAAYALDTSVPADGIADIVFVHKDTTATVAANFTYLVGTYTDTVGGRVWDTIVNGQPSTITTAKTVVLHDTTVSATQLVAKTLYTKLIVAADKSIDATNTKTAAADTSFTKYTAVQFNGGLLMLTGSPNAVKNCGADVPVYIFDSADGTVSTVTAAALTTTLTKTVVLSVAADTTTITGIYIY